MKKLFLTLVLVASINITKAQNVLYTNVYTLTNSDLVELATNYHPATALNYVDAMLETNDDPLVIYDNGTMLGTTAFSSMDDIREFISNLESVKKTGYYTDNANYTLAKGPYKSVVVTFKDRKKELYFSPYLVKQIKKSIK